MDINNLKKYHKNPRKITAKQHEFLEDSLTEFGDLSGVVVNIRNNEVVGGNQRTSIFQKHAKDVEIVITDGDRIVADSQGTVATGYILFKGSKYSYREVDWDADKEARANIIANKAGGFWDNDILANEFDENLLLESGFEDFELGMFNVIEDDGTGREVDESRLDDTLNTYLDGNIKQVVLYFKKDEYDGIIERLEKVKEHTNSADFTEVFEVVLEHYENTKSL